MVPPSVGGIEGVNILNCVDPQLVLLALGLIKQDIFHKICGQLQIGLNKE